MIRATLLALLLSSTLSAQYTWVQSPINGHCYALTSAMSWSQAEAAGVAAGGHLATVRTAAEHSWLYQTFVGPSGLAWIGLSDQAVEGVWVWSSGEPVTYTNWCPGEPNNQGNEDFVHMSGSCGWNDAINGSGFPSIIEVVTPAAAQPYGSGCAGTNGIPTLTPFNTPAMGTTFQIDAVNLPLQPVFAIGYFGFSRTAWSFLVLPLELSNYGLPGCYMLASPPPPGLILGAMTSNGQCSWSYPVPIAPWLVDLELYFQALIPDPGVGNPLGATVTNAIAARIGH